MHAFKRSGAFAVTLLVLALNAPASAACTSPQSFGAVAVADAGARVATLRLPAMRAPARRFVSAGSTTYVIRDVGEPPGSIDGQSRPFAFNDSGQIVGQSGEPSVPGAVHCVMYVGSGVFRDMSPSATVRSCTPESMTSEDTQGNVRIVGFIAVTYAPVVIGFETVYSIPHDATSMTAFDANEVSALSGVNATGEVVGPGTYEPPQTGFFTFDPELIGGPGARKLVAAQPECTDLQPGCGVDTYVANFATCPFGGCSINAAGTILACDLATGNAMTFAFGRRSPGVDLPFVAATGTSPAINDAGQVVYETAAPNLTTAAFVYSPASNASVEIPYLPGSTDARPLSINAAGRVLGSDDDTYWTWDPTDGLQDLRAGLPANPYRSIAALGINDDDRILVALNTASAVHWGTLVPARASPASRPRRSRSNGTGS